MPGVNECAYMLELKLAYEIALRQSHKLVYMSRVTMLSWGSCACELKRKSGVIPPTRCRKRNRI